ncbi:hypothetical protein ACKEN4_16885 [Acinetobacter baumannii]|uniref:hypothetical protein n=1 Tax=Acinetobacter baumannii TaxID=470 RepID=UPI002448EB02|nr:hypothetical protein [Acinetobacter baumannii]MDH2466816.1 hypothetical protein [Acinetobacter baumannii]MDO7516769.1 hypothetical protein [Acinetobacter baumannii]HCA5021217.1 hypothetical protein [Acinetobacter baumannii]HCH7479047.1 hypothetical protein [Acinetobacter baumannii]
MSAYINGLTNLQNKLKKLSDDKKISKIISDVEKKAVSSKDAKELMIKALQNDLINKL